MDVDDPIKVMRQIDAEVSQQRNTNFARAAEAHSLVASLVVLGVCLNVLISNNRYMTKVQDYALIIFTSVMLCLSNKPWLARNFWTVSFWYSVIMASVCAAVASGSSDLSQFLFIESSLIPPRLLFSVAYGGVPLVAFWNICYSVGFVMGFGKSERDQNWVDLLQIAWQREALIFSTVLFATLVTGEFLRKKVEREIEAKTLSDESNALTELLNLVCDVVVELDADLRIKHHSPKFAALVTLNANKDVQGQKLQEFMPVQSDIERFQECLLSYADDDVRTSRTQPGCLHATMRDSLSNNLQVEIFYVHYHDPDRDSHYFVGVREFTDVTALAELSPAGSSPSTKRRTKKRAQSLPMLRSDSGVDSDANSEGSISSDCASSVGSVAASNAAAAAAARDRLRLAHLKQTIDAAKDMMLADLVLHWNFCPRMTTCCPFHASMIELKRSLRRLEAQDCSKTFGQDFVKEVVWQCAACGVCALPDRLYVAERPTRCPACCGEWRAVSHVMAL